MCAKYNKNTDCEILDAALRVFAEKGYQGGSMAMIAREAGVSKGLAYHYFPSKMRLLVEIAKRRLSEWEPLVQALEQAPTARERLRVLVDWVFCEVQEKTDKIRFFNSLYLTPDGVEAIGFAMREHRHYFERLEACEHALLRDLGFEEVSVKVTLLRSMLQGACLDYMLSPDTYPLDDIRNEILTLFNGHE